MPRRSRRRTELLDPVAVLLVRLEGAVVLVRNAREKAFAAWLERLVEGKVFQPAHVTLPHRDRPARILRVGAQDLDHRVMILVPESPHGGLVAVNDPILERGPNRRRDSLLDERRVPHDRCVDRSPIRLCRLKERARHRIDERVRCDLSGGEFNRQAERAQDARSDANQRSRLCHEPGL